jgi:LysM repeat protein
MLGKHSLFWISLLSMVLVPALACNLPERNVGGLSFSTDQPQASQTLPLFPTDNPGLQAEATIQPPQANTIPGQASNPFFGLQTATPGAGSPEDWVTPEPGVTLPPFTYYTQPGDTAMALAGRFGVLPDQINPPQPLDTLLAPGQILTIPNVLGKIPDPSAVLPDSAVLFSPTAKEFIVSDYVSQSGGFLSTYRE